MTRLLYIPFLTLACAVRKVLSVLGSSQCWKIIGDLNEMQDCQSIVHLYAVDNRVQSCMLAKKLEKNLIRVYGVVGQSCGISLIHLIVINNKDYWEDLTAQNLLSQLHSSKATLSNPSFSPSAWMDRAKELEYNFIPENEGMINKLEQIKKEYLVAVGTKRRYLVISYGKIESKLEDLLRLSWF